MRARHLPRLSILSLVLFGLAGPLWGANPIELVSRGNALAVLDWRPTPMDPEVVERARRNQRELEARGLLDPFRATSRTAFGWPLRQRQGFDHPGCSATLSFVDHDPRAPGFLLDYHGGERTYDTDFDYNHQGTDLLAWPFGWTKVELDQVEVVAAAGGRIVDRYDGSFDQECSAGFDEIRRANLVVVAHEDGSIAIYGHLKSGSVTAKGIGDTVVRGEYLGVVGSSGHSGYPHLHFEVQDAVGAVIDPFAGPYNDTIAESWWSRQPRYYESQPLVIMTHSAEPQAAACNYAERIHMKDRFRPGEEVYLAAYLRDLRRGQRLKVQVFDPDGRRFASRGVRSQDPHWPISWAVFRIDLPSDALPGAWTFRARFQGVTLERAFQVGDLAPRIGVRSVQPQAVAAGGRRKVRIRGFGFHDGLVAAVQSPVEVEKRIRLGKIKIRQRKITLTVQVAADAAPGPRRIVLTAPDYSRIVLEDAFRVSAPTAGQGVPQN